MDRELSKQEQIKERKKRVLKAVLPIVAVLLILLLISFIMRKSVDKNSLLLSMVDVGDISLSYAASGVIVPAYEEIINSPINSKIVEVYHKPGDKVEAGTPLMKLDLLSAQTDLNKMTDEVAMKRLEIEQIKLSSQTRLNDFRMRIKVAAMKLGRSAVVLRNERYLDSLGSGTTDKVREAEMNYRTGELELQQLRQEYENEKRIKESDMQAKRLEYGILQRNLNETRRTLTEARIMAPRRAILSYINNQIGAQVGQGSKVAVVSDPDHFKVEGSIADLYASNVRVGVNVIVKIKGVQLAGSIINVDPLSHNGVVSFTASLKKDSDSTLRQGAKVEVYLLGQEKNNVMRIENNSYYSQPGIYELFVLEGNKLVKRSVNLGESSYDYVEVVSGLKVGDKVVVSDMEDYKRSKILNVK